MGILSTEQLCYSFGDSKVRSIGMGILNAQTGAVHSALDIRATA